MIDPDTLSLESHTYTRLQRPGLIDINRAGEAELLTLPGMTKARVKKLLDHRQAAGGFTSLDELRKIRGFSATLLEQVLPWAILASGTGTAP